MAVSSELKTSTSCFHCGDKIENVSYTLDDHKFC